MPDSEQHKCPHCERTFETQQGLSMHITRGHPEHRKGAMVHARAAVEDADGPLSASVNYCPQCGCNIALVNHVLGVVKGVAGAKDHR